MNKFLLSSFFLCVFSFLILTQFALAATDSSFPQESYTNSIQDTNPADTTTSTGWENSNLNGTNVGDLSGSTVTASGDLGGSTVRTSGGGGDLGGSTVIDYGNANGEVLYPQNTGLADPPGGVAQILSTFLSWLLGVFGIMALISFVISGTMYLLAAGSDDMIKRAKATMEFSIIGVIIALSGFIMIRAIDAALSGSAML